MFARHETYLKLKRHFETWITRNDVKGVSLFNLLYFVSLMAYLCSQRSINVQINYFMFDWSIYRIFVRNRDWKRDFLQIMIFVYDCSTCCIVELKTSFESWITMNDVNDVLVSPLLFNNTYGLPVFTKNTKCPNEVSYVFLSFYISFMPNTGWKHESLKMMIFVNVCSTWSLVELNTRFETWITRNDVNGVYVSPFLFNNTYVLPVLTIVNKRPNQVFYVWLVDLQTICAK
jgi:hypothetical protein